MDVQRRDSGSSIESNHSAGPTHAAEFAQQASTSRSSVERRETNNSGSPRGSAGAGPQVPGGGSQTALDSAVHGREGEGEGEGGDGQQRDGQEDDHSLVLRLSRNSGRSDAAGVQSFAPDPGGPSAAGTQAITRQQTEALGVITQQPLSRTSAASLRATSTPNTAGAAAQDSVLHAEAIPPSRQQVLQAGVQFTRHLADEFNEGAASLNNTENAAQAIQMRDSVAAVSLVIGEEASSPEQPLDDNPDTAGNMSGSRSEPLAHGEATVHDETTSPDAITSAEATAVTTTSHPRETFETGLSALATAGPKTTQEILWDAGKEAAVEFAAQYAAFWAGNLLTEPLAKAVGTDRAYRAAVAGAVSGISIVFNAGALLYTRVTPDNNVKPNMVSDLGHVAMLVGNIGALGVGLGTHTFVDNAAADFRALATVVAKRILSNIVSVDTHRNPQNTDKLKNAMFQAVPYLGMWTLANGGLGVDRSGTNHYRTGSSAGSITESFSSNLGPLTASSTAFALVEATNVFWGSFLRQKTDEHGPVIPEAAQTITGAEQRRKATSTNIVFQDQSKDIYNRTLSTADAAATVLAFFLVAFNSIGAVSKVESNDPLATGFSQGAIYAAIFATFLPFALMASTNNPSMGKYRENSILGKKLISEM